MKTFKEYIVKRDNEKLDESIFGGAIGALGTLIRKLSKWGIIAPALMLSVIGSLGKLGVGPGLPEPLNHVNPMLGGMIGYSLGSYLDNIGQKLQNYAQKDPKYQQALDELKSLRKELKV